MSSAAALPPLRHRVGATVTPGDRLGLIARGIVPGNGTYVRHGQLCASVLGTVTTSPVVVNDGKEKKEEGGERRWIVSIRPKQTRADTDARQNERPQVGMIILGRVTRVVRPSHASVDIIAIVPENGDSIYGGGRRQHGTPTRPLVVPLREPYSGTLRQGEIKPKSSLDVRIDECVRPGDAILARIHADGEREYILTTAEAELGVVRAVCEGSGVVMEAVNWKEMRCPVTLAREGRKVAKRRLA